jgi:hypothetical protein
MRGKKVSFMNRLNILTLLIILLLIGCSSITAKSRRIDFDGISKAYRHAIRESDFWAAYQFTDPANNKKEFDVERYKNTQVVKYKVVNIDIAADHLTVKQNVEIEYYLLDRVVLQTIQDRQLWKYDKKNQSWLLQTGLPVFNTGRRKKHNPLK